VTAALCSGRWTLTGGWTGEESLERRFARRFAAFLGVEHCVATDHGASSLLVALEALGVGAGDEVIVPVLTWVATATAVLNVNAVPVFVDVEPGTGCIAAEAVKAAISPRTAAIMVVHLHCRMADMDVIAEVAAAAGVPVVEDCAQAHGARWGGASAGSLGAVGAFSMQQNKVLTAGEGGAVVTGDAAVHDRIQQLKADGRRYRGDEPALGEPALTDSGDVMGNNFALSELQAGLLLDQLDRLEPQLERRAAAARRLDERLGAVPGLSPLDWSPRLTRPSVFEYAVRRQPGAFAGRPTGEVCAAVAAELGVRVHQTDVPLHRNPLYCPETKARYRWVSDRARPAPGTRFPAAEALAEELILVPHRVLLADDSDLDDVVEAFAKVSRHAGEL